MKIIVRLIGFVICVGLAGIGFLFWHFGQGLPQIVNPEDYRPAIVSEVYAENGDVIGEFFKERRYVVPFESIPQDVVHAFLAAEDDRFFEHPGINILSMIRAGIANFRAGHVVQGGSTITQQVAKSLLLTPERSFDRKIKEVILASRIERNLSKQSILYLYLNQIYLGHGAYGVEAASRIYFHKNVGQLDVAQAALLAGLPQAPSKYSPLLNPRRAKERQIYVLRRMLENRFISQDAYLKAIDEPLMIYHSVDMNKKGVAPYFIESVRQYVQDHYGEHGLYEEGLKIYTGVKPKLMQAAKESLRQGLRAIDKRTGYRGPLRHLGREEIEPYCREQAKKILAERLVGQVLTREGAFDKDLSLRQLGVVRPQDMLNPERLYDAVVVQTDKKKTLVRVGEMQAELQDTKHFKIGDVIRVKMLGANRVSLEQDPLLQGALVSMDLKTGCIQAFVGGYDFELSEFNRVTQAIRQIGSAFKPVIYSAALEKGFTPTSIIVDSPLVFRDGNDGTTWKPNNYEDKFYGDTTFRQALIKSRNIPTIKIVQQIGVPQVIDYAKRMGISSSFPVDLSIALGSSSLTLLDITKVYAIFPRLGKKIEPLSFARIEDGHGKVLEDTLKPPVPIVSPSPVPSEAGQFSIQTSFHDPVQVVDPRVAYVMTHLMKEVVAYGTGHEAKNLNRPAAGKTGTTNEAMDAWFIGFTPEVITGVWVGYDAQKSIGVGETGARAALPIWLDYMRVAVEGMPVTDFLVPDGITFAFIDPITGRAATEKTPHAISEAFIAGTEPVSGQSEEVDFFQEDKD